jgi:hypothetical protein
MSYSLLPSNQWAPCCVPDQYRLAGPLRYVEAPQFPYQTTFTTLPSWAPLFQPPPPYTHALPPTPSLHYDANLHNDTNQYQRPQQCAPNGAAPQCTMTQSCTSCGLPLVHPQHDSPLPPRTAETATATPHGRAGCYECAHAAAHPNAPPSPSTTTTTTTTSSNLPPAVSSPPPPHAPSPVTAFPHPIPPTASSSATTTTTLTDRAPQFDAASLFGSSETSTRSTTHDERLMSAVMRKLEAHQSITERRFLLIETMNGTNKDLLERVIARLDNPVTAATPATVAAHASTTIASTAAAEETRDEARRDATTRSQSEAPPPLASTTKAPRSAQLDPNPPPQIALSAPVAAAAAPHTTTTSTTQQQASSKAPWSTTTRVTATHASRETAMQAPVRAGDTTLVSRFLAAKGANLAAHLASGPLTDEFAKHASRLDALHDSNLPIIGLASPPFGIGPLVAMLTQASFLLVTWQLRGWSGKRDQRGIALGRALQRFTPLLLFNQTHEFSSNKTLSITFRETTMVRAETLLRGNLLSLIEGAEQQLHALEQRAAADTGAPASQRSIATKARRLVEANDVSRAAEWTEVGKHRRDRKTSTSKATALKSQFVTSNPFKALVEEEEEKAASDDERRERDEGSASSGEMSDAEEGERCSSTQSTATTSSSTTPMRSDTDAKPMIDSLFTTPTAPLDNVSRTDCHLHSTLYALRATPTVVAFARATVAAADASGEPTESTSASRTITTRDITPADVDSLKRNVASAQPLNRSADAEETLDAVLAKLEEERTAATGDADITAPWTIMLEIADACDVCDVSKLPKWQHLRVLHTGGVCSDAAGGCDDTASRVLEHTTSLARTTQSCSGKCWIDEESGLHSNTAHTTTYTYTFGEVLFVRTGLESVEASTAPRSNLNVSSRVTLDKGRDFTTTAIVVRSARKTHWYTCARADGTLDCDRMVELVESQPRPNVFVGSIESTRLELPERRDVQLVCMQRDARRPWDDAAAAQASEREPATLSADEATLSRAKMLWPGAGGYNSLVQRDGKLNTTVVNDTLRLITHNQRTLADTSATPRRTLALDSHVTYTMSQATDDAARAAVLDKALALAKAEANAVDSSLEFSEPDVIFAALYRQKHHRLAVVVPRERVVYVLDSMPDTSVDESLDVHQFANAAGALWRRDGEATPFETIALETRRQPDNVSCGLFVIANAATIALAAAATMGDEERTTAAPQEVADIRVWLAHLLRANVNAVEARRRVTVTLSDDDDTTSNGFEEEATATTNEEEALAKTNEEEASATTGGVTATATPSDDGDASPDESDATTATPAPPTPPKAEATAARKARTAPSGVAPQRRSARTNSTAPPSVSSA